MNSAQRRRYLRKLRRTVYRVAEEMDLEVDEKGQDAYNLTDKEKCLGLAPEDDWEDHFGNPIFLVQIDHRTGHTSIQFHRSHEERFKHFRKRFLRLMK